MDQGDRIALKAAHCPVCGEHWSASGQGPWGEWLLWEAVCNGEGSHYWAMDLYTGSYIAPIGYRYDRERQSFALLTDDFPEGCRVAKYGYPPDPKGIPPDTKYWANPIRATKGVEGTLVGAMDINRQVHAGLLSVDQARKLLGLGDDG